MAIDPERGNATEEGHCKGSDFSCKTLLRETTERGKVHGKFCCAIPEDSDMEILRENILFFKKVSRNKRSFGCLRDRYFKVLDRSFDEELMGRLRGPEGKDLDEDGQNIFLRYVEECSQKGLAEDEYGPKVPASMMPEYTQVGAPIEVRKVSIPVLNPNFFLIRAVISGVNRVNRRIINGFKESEILALIGRELEGVEKKIGDLGSQINEEPYTNRFNEGVNYDGIHDYQCQM